MEFIIDERWNRRIEALDIAGDDIISRNLQGLEKPNRPFSKGNRTFGIILPRDLAEKMFDDGWPVKALDSDDPERNPAIYIRAEYENGDPARRPRIYICSEGVETRIEPEDFYMIDEARLDHVDARFHLGGTGKTIYLDEAYFYLQSTAWLKRHGGKRSTRPEDVPDGWDDGFGED